MLKKRGNKFMSTPNTLPIIGGVQAHTSSSFSFGNGIITSVSVTNGGSGYLIGPQGAQGSVGLITPQGVQAAFGNQMFSGFSMPAPLPTIKHCNIVHVKPHMNWKKLRYVKERWDLEIWWNYDSSSKSTYDEAFHRSPKRSFPTEQDARNAYILEKFEE